MRGSSRGAAATVQEASTPPLSGGVDRSGLAEDLFRDHVGRRRQRLAAPGPGRPSR